MIEAGQPESSTDAVQPTPFHRAVVRSFYSRTLYREVFKLWRWRSIAYLAVVLVAAWSPLVLRVAREMHVEAMHFLSQLPVLTLSDGRVSAEVEQPYIVRSTEGAEVLIIDTTGEITSLDGREAEMLLTATKFIAKQRDIETRTIDLSQSRIENLRVTPDLLTKWYRVFGVLMVPFMWMFLVAGSLCYRVVQALFYSLFGIALARVAKVSLGYPGILSLSMVAVTPALVLKTLLMNVGLRFHFSWILFFAVAMGYLWFAVLSCRRTDAGGGAGGEHGGTTG